MMELEWDSWGQIPPDSHAGCAKGSLTVTMQQATVALF